MINNCVLRGNTAGGIDTGGAQSWGGTWNVAYNAATVAYTGGGTVANMPTAKDAHSSIAHSTGKHYAEFNFSMTGNYGPMIGVITTDGIGSYSDPFGICFWCMNAGNSGLQVGADYYPWGTPLVPGDTLGMLVDMDNLLVTFYKNRTPMGTAPYPLTAGKNYMIVGASPGGNSPVVIALLASATVP